MTQTATPQPAQPPPDLVTVADVMRPPLTTADTNDHVAAAAYLMKHAGATALTVLDTRTGQPQGILTVADVARAVADGKDLNDLRIRELMTTRPAVINPAASIRDAARIMTRGLFRHLPVCGDSGLGFSQGGAMVLQLMRRAPGRFQYGVQLAGFVVDDYQPGDEVLARQRPPVFWGRGERDTVIPQPAIARTQSWMAAHSHVHHP